MRPRRIVAPETFFHVTARGNNRQAIFRTDDEKQDFLGRIQTIFPSHQIRLMAYEIMTNHFHLLLEDVKGGALPRAMERLEGGYARNWNRRYGRCGHVFGERYHAEVVQTDEHLVVGSCYIHNNCVRACMVRHAAQYRWSSVHAYLGRKSDLEVSTGLILDICGGRKSYARLLRDTEATHEEHGKSLPDAEQVRGLYVSGSEQFRESTRSIVERRSDRRKRAVRPAGMLVEDIWKLVRAKTNVSPQEIKSRRRHRRISLARRMFCALARREGMRAVEIADVIHRTTSAAVRLADSIDLCDHHV